MRSQRVHVTGSKGDEVQLQSPDYFKSRPRRLRPEIESVKPSPGFGSCWASDARDAFTALIDRLGCADPVRAIDVVIWIEEADEDE